MDTIFNNLDYRKYCLKNNIHKLPGINIDLENYGDIVRKTTKKWETVDAQNTIPSSAELDDLIRLHYIIRKRKVRTIMEFGVGKSTVVMLDAIEKNKRDYKQTVNDNLRVSTAFELYTIDNNEHWLNNTIDIIGNNPLFYPHLCPLAMGTFADRICTYYDNLPNLRPDFIYLDGPDQYSAVGSIRGINTNHPDRMPMAADILAIEHFLEPGTLILVDGRTANARFLKANLQLNWEYKHFKRFDQHLFILKEEPLGKWNEAAMKFTES